MTSASDETWRPFNCFFSWVGLRTYQHPCIMYKTQQQLKWILHNQYAMVQINISCTPEGSTANSCEYSNENLGFIIDTCFLNYLGGYWLMTPSMVSGLTVETWVQSQPSTCGICGDKSGTETGFSLGNTAFGCQCHSSITDTTNITCILTNSKLLPTRRNVS